jgi:hypothetical protein
MKNHVLCFVIATAIAAPQIARAERSEPIVPPPVPEGLELSPQEYTPFLVAHAVGTQGYVCVVVGAAYSWVPYGPQATLFNADGEQVLTHFLSPRPYDQVLNPAWQHSRDSSIVWAQVLKPSDDPNFVAPGAIPWLLLEATVVGDGPTGGDKMIKTRRIQRLNTVEGKAPTTGCAAPANIGKRALVPYEADYFFYKENAGHQQHGD